ncbi:MAG: hypothetical protein FJ267_03335, partial [Planctomycetes bacterium]|nr:hypothetical protein [Planctomycetota bacterium]
MRLRTFLLIPSLAWGVLSMHGQVITHQFKIRPVSIADDSGANANTVVINETYLDKIYRQAGIDVVVLPTVTFNKTDRQNIGGQGEVNSAGGNL